MILLNLSITHMDLVKDKMLLQQKVEHDPQIHICNREGQQPPGCTKRSISRRLREIILPLSTSEHVEHCVHFWDRQYIRDLDSV